MKRSQLLLGRAPQRFRDGRRRVVAGRRRSPGYCIAAGAKPHVLGGAQIDRPNERPYALHRNGYAGMQRYASFLWSGDVYSKWETLKTHIPIAINTALSGIPYWGTDIGGFVPTPEFTAELYLRWFQFGAFCPLFRSHGRTWKLRLPWGWNTGDPGPVEIKNYEAPPFPIPASCTTRESNASAENIWNCVTGCCPIFIARCAMCDHRDAHHARPVAAFPR